MKNKTEEFARLLKIMDELRVQCPWDKKQTMDSLRYLTIEELYELSDAILDKDMSEIKKELGDVLWYISNLCTELDFNLEDVALQNLEKLKLRAAKGNIRGSGDDR